MDLSIIIVAYKNKNILRECLKCIKKANLGLSYEIIVVDNASGDGTAKMLNFEFPEVVAIVSPRNLGFAGGNNLAVARAWGDKILFLNPDVVICQGAAEKMSAYLDNHPEAGLVGPKLLNADGTLQYSVYRFPKWYTPIFRRTPLGLLPFGKRHLRDYLMVDWNHNEVKDVDWLLGSALIMRKADYGKSAHPLLPPPPDGRGRQSGGGIAKFDERFFLYFEDGDLARQVWAGGTPPHQLVNGSIVDKEKSFKAMMLRAPEERLSNWWGGKKVVYLPYAQMIHFHRRESAHFGFIKGLFHKPTREHIKSWIKYFWKWR